MFELSDSMQWTKLRQTLQHDHLYPLAIPIPDKFVSEQIQEKNKPKRRKL